MEWDQEHQDHPRSRGVYLRMKRQLGPESGSSPLARGLHPLVDGEVMGRRIIPARAGFTRRDPRRGLAPRDHPRSRGVYPTTTRPDCSAPGSSPLARGLPAELGRQTAYGGIIPARAGFTGTWPWSWTTTRDHPRSRGVYVPPGCGRGSQSGSSPLARGLREEDGAVLYEPGIIPARAGFTRPLPSGAAVRGDHPRSRGVYPPCAPGPPIPGGSSPLARGLPVGDRRLGRAIPDHPRSRGVYSKPSWT